MDESPHSELELLLPWYATGTLAEDERRALERHLTACAACREELERCRVLGSVLARDTPPAPAPHPAQLARLRARIARGELDREGEPERGARRASRLFRSWRATSRPVRWLLAAQTAALLAAGAWIAAPDAGTPRPFRTLAGAESGDRRASLRVVFAPGVQESQVRSLLLEVRAEIVGGPSPLGAYALALVPGVAGESPDAVLPLLRADPRVRLAEPIAEAGDAAP
jgi:anti-sigma factor RsiW